MKRKNQIVLILLISAIFVAGFFVGQKVINPPKPQTAQAETVQKIHNSKFYKEVVLYFIYYSSPSDYRLSPDKKRDLIRQLIKDGYFHKMPTKAQRLDYIRSRNPRQNKGVLTRILANGFEKDNNYSYYLGNTSNSVNHTAYDFFYTLGAETLGLTAAADMIVVADPEGVSTIRSLAFDYTGLKPVPACEDLTQPKCLFNFVLDTKTSPRLRLKQDIPEPVLRKIYNTKIFSGYWANFWMGEWQEDELRLLLQVINLNDKIIDFMLSAPNTYDDAKQIIKLIGRARKVIETKYTINPGANASPRKGVFGILIPRPTKAAVYEFPEGGSLVEISDRDLRFMTTETSIPETNIKGLASSLRRGPLLKRIEKLLNLFRKMDNDYFQREVTKGYTVKFNDAIGLGPRDYASGLHNDDLKMIVYLGYPPEYRGEDYTTTYVHEYFHAAQPEITFLGNKNTILGEAFIEFMTSRWIANNGYTYHGWECGYPDFIYRNLKQKIAIKHGGDKNASKILDDFFTDKNPKAHRPLILSDLNLIFGERFIQEFVPLAEKYREHYDTVYRVSLSASEAKLATKNLDEITKTINKKLRYWQVP